ncbi:MAG: M24 family metallopeptidase [Chloroflexota bacterium]
MKSDIDQLMADRSLDALLIPIGEMYSPQLDYLVGGAHLSSGLAIKKRDEATVLIVSGMELQEAQSSGHQAYNLADFGWYEIYEATGRDSLQTTVDFWARCLDKRGIPGGRIGVYGVGLLHALINQIDLARESHPQYMFVGESGRTLFDEAAITKDAAELTRIESVAERTNRVLQLTWDFIAGHRAANGQVVNADGQPLTIGGVRRYIRRALLDHDLEDTGLIFAQGTDAGYPHSRGQDEQALMTGKSIVFDLFPREFGGGYHHDVTRTWCIDFAPTEVQQTYETVMNAFDIALESFSPGKPTHLMQEAVLDYFEELDHPTARSQPGTEAGYVHSLGHGLGLEIHEKPSISHLRHDDHFQVGNVVTIEPGLYYPEQGYGVRIEDTFVVTEAGELRSLSSFHKKLVIKLSG